MGCRSVFVTCRDENIFNRTSIESKCPLFMVCYPFWTLIRQSRPASDGSHLSQQPQTPAFIYNLMSTCGCQNVASKMAHHLIHLLKQLLHASDIFLCRFHLPVSDMLCYTAEEAVQSEHNLFVLLSHLVFLWPLSACGSAHSTFNSQALTHSLVQLGLFTAFNCFLFIFISALAVKHTHTHIHTYCIYLPLHTHAHTPAVSRTHSSHLTISPAS